MKGPPLLMCNVSFPQRVNAFNAMANFMMNLLKIMREGHGPAHA